METFICSKCKTEKFKNEKCRTRNSCKLCKSISDANWRKKNKKHLADYFRVLAKKPHRIKSHKIIIERKRFGINATEFVKNKKCKYCGMANELHLKKWNERLQIHHKDGNGRRAMNKGEIPNNYKLNFEIVCRKCHGRIEMKKRYAEWGVYQIPISNN